MMKMKMKLVAVVIVGIKERAIVQIVNLAIVQVVRCLIVRVDHTGLISNLGIGYVGLILKFWNGHWKKLRMIIPSTFVLLRRVVGKLVIRRNIVGRTIRPMKISILGVRGTWFRNMWDMVVVLERGPLNGQILVLCVCDR